MHQKKYILAIVLAVLVLAFNQGYIQYCLNLKNQDAVLINTAGKQRMYSQKILHEYELWYISGTPPADLMDLYREWKLKNEELLEHSLDNKEDDFSTLQNLSHLIETQEPLLKSFPTRANIEQLNSSMQYFLTTMDDLVLEYQHKADEKLSNIRQVEFLLFGLSLLLLFLEFYFVFGPLIRDLTAKSKALKKSYESLAQRKHELEQLTYAISHDIQEPISMFQSLLNRYQKKKKKGEIIFNEKIIDHLNLRISKANKLLSDLLVYTGSRVKHTKESFDLKTLVAEVASKINCHEKIDTSEIHNLKLYGYKSDISLVLEHLLINAITYQSKDRLLQVKIHQEIEDKHCVIKIKDNGIGIAEHKIHTVFNLFKSGDKESAQRTGFGLAFCKKIIEEHGGKIGVSSQLDEGTEFYFRLPLVS
ncbi:Signal transduction histidine kinase [Lishizhenia tianjinensis]|uniref:histidine kinase n=1 Tax=Lishizhenia tianjinensis TaxID=477690 RepID=A0A1I6YMD1_9FLAO|nr:HAMP domain-containing sensor histidine kinase [Lishizhenia tianjinensis]SFT51587.1 Signal transduction histidine kinase [Lishizhenia tianjinensis]